MWGRSEGIGSHNTYHQKILDRFGEAHHMHGNSHSIGEGEKKPNGTPKLWAQTARDEEVGPPCAKHKGTSSDI